MVIIETPIFTKQLLSTLSDEEYRLFQATLLERPDAGKVVLLVGFVIVGRVVRRNAARPLRKDNNWRQQQ